MKRLLLVVALAACSGPATNGLAPTSPMGEGPALKGGAAHPGITCHLHDRFFRKHRLLIRSKETTTARQQQYFFIGGTVWNHLRQVTVTAYPVGGAGGSEQFTILPGHAITQQFNPPTKGITITVPTGSRDPGPGVEVNATSCKQ